MTYVIIFSNGIVVNQFGHTINDAISTAVRELKLEYAQVVAAVRIPRHN